MNEQIDWKGLVFKGSGILKPISSPEIRPLRIEVPYTLYLICPKCSRTLNAERRPDGDIAPIPCPECYQEISHD